MCLFANGLLRQMLDLPTPWMHWTLGMASGLALGYAAFLGVKTSEARRICLPVFVALLIGIRLLQFSTILPHQEKKFLANRNGPRLANFLTSRLPDGTNQVLVYGHMYSELYFYAKNIRFLNITKSVKQYKEPYYFIFRERYYPGFKKRFLRFQEMGSYRHQGERIVLVKTGPLSGNSG